MKIRLTFAVLAAAVATSLVAIPGAIAAPPAQAPAAAPAVAGLPLPINFTSALGSFNGTFNVNRFAVQNGQLVAIGNLTGTVTDALGNVVGTIDQALTVPVAGTAATGSCQILDLVLGPLDLNLLGLVVHLDTVHLNITAQQGPGNLLGNLLCSVAHLLDNTGGTTVRPTRRRSRPSRRSGRRATGSRWAVAHTPRHRGSCRRGRRASCARRRDTASDLKVGGAPDWRCPTVCAVRVRGSGGCC